MKRGGKSNFNPWYSKSAGGSFQKQKEKPLFSVPRSNLIDEDDDDDEGPEPLLVNPSSTSEITFSTDREPGSYIGWKLYFPLKSEWQF